MRRRPFQMVITSGSVTAPAQPTGLAVAATSATQFDLSWTDNATNETAYKVYRSTDGTNYAQVGTDLAADANSYSDTTVSAGQIYYYKVAAVNAGGETLSAASDPAYYFADNFDRADGAIGNGWTAAAGWVIASNIAKNTPALGSDILTNGGLEAPYTAGIANGWVSTGGTLSEEGTVVHGGSSSQQVDVTNVAQGVRQTGITLTPSEWYAASAWFQTDASKACLIQVQDGNGAFIDITRNINGSFAQVYGAMRAAGAGNYFQAIENTAGTYTIYIDDAALQQITKSTLFAVRDTGMSDIDISINLANAYYLDVRQMGGIVACMDDAANPTNYLHAFYFKNAVYLDKVVNGNITNLINVTVSHVTNAALRLVKDGTSVGVYYNGTQRGATQTVSDVDLISNTIHGIAGAHANTTINNLVMVNPT